MFRRDVALGVVMLIADVVHPGEVAGDGDEGADEEAEEGEAVLAGVKSVDLNEDDWVGFEEDVEDTWTMLEAVVHNSGPKPGGPLNGQAFGSYPGPF